MLEKNKKFIFIVIVLLLILYSLTIIYTYERENIYQDEQLKKCKSLSQKYKDVCLYETAVKIAHTDSNKSLLICSNIKDRYNSGRCYSDIIGVITNNDKSKINKSLIICKNIRNNYWKSECYFNVAESVYINLIEPSPFNKSYINLVFDICENSELFKDNCYSHILWELNLTKISDTCEYMPKEHKNICYYILGANLANDIYSPENKHKCLKNFSECYLEASNFCQSIEEKYRINCNSGLWDWLDHGNLLNICESVNKTYKKDCYNSLGVVIGKIEPNPFLITCEIANEEYKLDCYEGFWKLTREWETPKICESYDETYRQICRKIFNECFEIDGVTCCNNIFRTVCRPKI